ncbi:PDK, partial [Symbiodinium microadriaticum]
MPDAYESQPKSASLAEEVLTPLRAARRDGREGRERYHEIKTLFPLVVPNLQTILQKEEAANEGNRLLRVGQPMGTFLDETSAWKRTQEVALLGSCAGEDLQGSGRTENGQQFYPCKHLQLFDRGILDAKTPKQAAKLAYRELPIRYAQRILQIEGLPGWEAAPELVEVHRLYSENFKDIRLVDLDMEDLEPFTSVIETIKGRMKEVIPMLATSMRNLQQAEGYPEREIVQWLDSFFLSRIGTEMLTSQYMACTKPEAQARRRSRVGVVDYACDPVSICEQAARHARKLCKQHFADDADVDISVVSSSAASTFDLESRIRFPYVPNYLFYIMVELLKNSARATVEARQESPQKKRSIVITVGADPSQVAIRVLDQAGGIPFSVADRVWSYMYSTATKGGRNFNEQGTPLAGYGVGLPLSRLYARYLGGSLHLQSLPGVGTCAY